MKPRTIITRFLRILLTPADEWKHISGQTLPLKGVTNSYIIPLICLCMLVSFVCTALYNHSLEAATSNTLLTGIILLGTYVLTISVGIRIVRKIGIPHEQTYNLRTLGTYAMSGIFATHLLTKLIPQADYLQITSLYTAWLLYEGCKTLLPHNKEQHIGIVVILTICLAGFPIILRMVLKWLLPNL